MDPAETHTCRFASMVEPSLAREARTINIDGLSGRILCWKIRSAGAKQVLEPDRDICRSGVETGTAGGGFGDAARSLIVSANEKLAALLSVWKERCALHVERVQSALCKDGCILFMCRRLESVAKKVISDVGVEGGSAGNASEMLIGKPTPACGVVGESEVRNQRRSFT